MVAAQEQPTGEQPTLVGLAVPAPGTRDTDSGEESRLTDPVAEVLVDSHLAHLDRPFEYAVPTDLDDLARPGVRVRVRFAGRVVDGYVLRRSAEAEHPGRLAPLLKVVSAEVVLTPHLARLCRELADHYAGTLADVLRLAIPPRHARAEKSLPVEQPMTEPPTTEPPTTEPPTTEPPTTEPPTSEPPTSEPPTSEPPTSEPPTSEPPTSEPPTSESSTRQAAGRSDVIEPDGWQSYPAGAALVRRLAAGESPAAAWTALPDAGSAQGWPTALSTAVAAVHASGRGSLVVLPDYRDVDRLAAVLDGAVGQDAYVRLTADLGPEQRYRAWLKVLRGHVRIVIGSRSAAFAPVRDLGLVAWWDDGDDNLQEPRAPYPHVREVLRRRAAISGAGLLVGGYTTTPQIQHWVSRGDLRLVRGSAAAVAQRAPRVTVAGEGHQGARDAAAASARMPSIAWRAVKDGLLSGPVLVQVPRRGYLVALSCEQCRTPVRCTTCAGPLQRSGAGVVPACAWCGRADSGQPCRECGDRSRRSSIVGEERTAEEVGRAFPGARIVVSRAGQVLATVPDRPAVVVATPGAEPVADSGYAAILLLDGWALLDRGGLDSGVEALRRWTAAAALSRPGTPVVLAGVPPHARLRPVEALVRWDPVWLAARELDERAALGLPPVRRTATVTGDPDAVSAAQQRLAGEVTGGPGQGGGPPGTHFEIFGPLPARGGTDESAQLLRLVVRERTVADGQTGGPDSERRVSGGPDSERPDSERRVSGGGKALPAALQALRAARSLRKAGGELHIRLDPVDLDL
ncbi:primosomal protein N' family DNA-binding protein [Ornithinimicrobium ciconiae]|uniref:primosomal protein N' family DNA-binding protein n=1 Tax=Ornithinimicrobium ciconiae TaxID=2594265 RepID=UPI001D192D55|nr:primosome assembly protein PriA [Ornithinimicrobium ciconiae]